MKFIVEDDSSFVKDGINNSIINRNRQAYLEYCDKKARAVSDKRKVETLEREVKDLKQMMAKILERLDGTTS